ncbi:MAG: hypothetical protein U5R31_09860 [Acidimicrobiia bacterium]|nr:hypothetical protein [Acidimicrobiia bacterium]
MAREGPFDLVLLGRNSVDADTGQVPPQLAELLDLPFLTGVRALEVVATDGSTAVGGDRVRCTRLGLPGRALWRGRGRRRAGGGGGWRRGSGGRWEVRAGCEHDDEWVEATVALPAVLSVAERLCEPSKVPPEGRAEVPAERIRAVTADDLGPGPWGQAGSPTSVGEVRVLDVDRLGLRLEGPVESSVEKAVQVLVDRGALEPGNVAEFSGEVVAHSPGGGPALAVVVEPDRAHITRELLGAAARLGHELDGRTVALGSEPGDPAALGSWGVHAVVVLDGARVEEDVAVAVASWADEVRPWAILGPGAAWGREVLSRVSARLGAGLTGDAVGLAAEEGRLVAWKPAFGGKMVAAIHCSSPVQMATVRAGVLPLHEPAASPGTAGVGSPHPSPRTASRWPPEPARTTSTCWRTPIWSSGWARASTPSATASSIRCCARSAPSWRRPGR